MSDSRFKEKQVEAKAKCWSCEREKLISEEGLCESCDKHKYSLELVDGEVKEKRSAKNYKDPDVFRSPLNHTPKQIQDWTLKQLIEYKRGYDMLQKPVEKLKSALRDLGV